MRIRKGGINLDDFARASNARMRKWREDIPSARFFADVLTLL